MTAKVSKKNSFSTLSYQVLWLGSGIRPPRTIPLGPKLLAENEKSLAEQDKLLAEKEKSLTEQNKMLVEKEKSLAEKDNKIISMAKALLDKGMSPAQVAGLVGISEDELRQSLHI